MDGPQDFVTNMVAEFERRRDFMYGQITKMRGMSCVKPKGAFYLFPNVSRTRVQRDDPARDLLEKYRVVTARGSAFGGYPDSYVRISLASSMDNLKTSGENAQWLGLSLILKSLGPTKAEIQADSISVRQRCTEMLEKFRTRIRFA